MKNMNIMKYKLSESSKRLIAEELGTSKTIIDDLNDDRSYRFQSGKRIPKKDVDTFAKRRQKAVDRFNRKLEREIKKASTIEDKKMLYDTFSEMSKDVHYYTNNEGMDITSAIAAKAVRGDSEDAANLMNKNFSRRFRDNNDALYDALKIELDDSLITTKQDQNVIMKTLGKMNRKNSMMTVEVVDGVRIPINKYKEFEENVKRAKYEQDEFYKYIQSSDIMDNAPGVTFSDRPFDLHGVRDYSDFMARSRQVEKYATPGYWAQATSQFKENFIKAAHSSMTAMSSAKVEDLVRNSSDNDFEAYTRLYSEPIIFLYESVTIHEESFIEEMESYLG